MTEGGAEGFELAAALASRICHDLVSPVGAIGNGVELLGMAGLQNSPELALVGDSVRHAEARIRVFRVAFGQAEPGQSVGAGEIAAMLAGYWGGGRLRLGWPVAGPVPRPELRAVFLALLCLETELAFGGEIAVEGGPGGWALTARAARMRGEAAWEVLAGGGMPEGISPALLQFALLPMAVAALGRQVETRRREGEISLRF